MDDNESLTGVFSEVGARYGYSDVTASFAAFRDFKVKWMRSYRWVNFEVSDYLKGSPDDVLGSIAETLYMKMRGETESSYPQEVTDWLTSREFRDRNQPIYLGRYRSLSLDTKGENLDLSDSIRRLREMGLVEDDPDVVVRWRFNSRSNSATRSSVLMRTIVVSDRLDREDVPDLVIDYVLYAEIARIGMGFNPGGPMDDKRYVELLRRYPYMDEAEEGLRRLDIRL